MSIGLNIRPRDKLDFELVFHKMPGLSLILDIAFNIVAQGEDNAAWLVTDGTLYSVDLKTGKAISAGKLEGIKGKLTDIAWVD